ncbi:Uncharacterised protein [Staphylococcus aureus]|nr:Uncharacterised protein [Staphylococcus aureus]
MIKFNLNWLNIGTPLFLFTYINLTVFIVNIFQPNILNSINKLINIITNNHISKISENITYDILLNLYWFYFYLIGVCLSLFLIAGILAQFNKINPLRLGHILGWFISLLVHQFNIMLIIIMINHSMFSEFNYINITFFLLFTYIYLGSYNSSKDCSDA